MQVLANEMDAIAPAIRITALPTTLVNALRDVRLNPIHIPAERCNYA